MEHLSPRQWPWPTWAGLVGGCGLVVLALTADFVGIGGSPGFGLQQARLATLGTVIALAALVLRPDTALVGYAVAVRDFIRARPHLQRALIATSQVLGLALLAAAAWKGWLGVAAGHGPSRKVLLAGALGLVLGCADHLDWLRRRALPWLAATPLLNNRAFVVATVLLVLLLNAFALHQVWRHGRYLCYQNAFDEITYLQFDISKSCQGLTRPGQFLVTFGHLLGLSGGWINLLFDIVTPIAFLGLARWVFRRLKFAVAQANLAALALVLLPLLFLGGYNPLLHRLFDYCYQSGLVYWVSTPQAWFLPLERSPEPQFSLVLLTAAIGLSLRFRSFVPAYVCLPFLYPFVALPAGFCVLAQHLSTRRPWFARHAWLAALVAAVIVLTGVSAYFTWIIPARQRDLFVESHAPILSVSGVLALGLFACLRRFIPPELRRLAFFIALAPTVAANQQVVTGWFSCPHCYEQNSGVVAGAIVAALALAALARHRVVEYAAVILLGLLACDHARKVYLIQKSNLAPVPYSAEVLQALRDDSADVAINDPIAAAYVALLYPRQPTTIFAWQNTYCPLAGRQFDRYLWAREALKQRPELAAAFHDTFTRLEPLYRCEADDFILAHCGRKSDFVVRHDAAAVPTGTYGPLKVFLVSGGTAKRCDP